MEGLQVYAVVYIAVKKHIKTHVPPKGFERFWDFARIIPHYGEVTSEQADALTTSVSHCKIIGLQGFYQVKISWSDVSDLIMNGEMAVTEPELLELKKYFYEENEESDITLGDFVRRFFNGRLVLNQNDETILASIIGKDRNINRD